MFNKYIYHDYSKGISQISCQMEKDRKSRECISENEIKARNRVDISLEEYEEMKCKISDLKWENNNLRELFKDFKDLVKLDVIPDSIEYLFTEDIDYGVGKCRVEFDFILNRNSREILKSIY